MNTNSDKEGSFIHFGCWNKHFCNNSEVESSDDNGITRVMRLLRNYIKDNKRDFMIVAGDNYYPDISKEKKDGKKIKIKKIVKKNLCSGLNCLPKNITTYLLLGNHDLEDKIKLETEKNEFIEYNKDTKNLECCILKFQQNYVKQNKNMIMDDYTNKDALHQIIEKNGNKTLVLMIDTNIYEKDSIEKFENCLKLLENYNGTNEEEKYRIEIMEKHYNRIINVVHEVHKMGNLKNIVFVGHHPISRYVRKEEGSPIKYVYMEDFGNMVMSVYEKLETNDDIKFYNLCADTHLYQKGIIRFNNGLILEQHICGTGGTDLDAEVTADNINNVNSNNRIGNATRKIFNNNNSFKMKNHTYDVKESEKKYGFLDVIMNDDGSLTFNPILIPEIKPQTAGKKLVKNKKSSKRKNTKKSKKSRKNKSRK